MAMTVAIVPAAPVAAPLKLLRRGLQAALVTLTLGHASVSLGAATSEGTLLIDSVQSPYYGDLLYHFYQKQYFSALTGLMVSQQLNRLKPHEADAELLRGGMLLSNGLHREAGQVFERLAEKGVDTNTRRKAWLYLAKTRYQRGLPTEAAAALARIDGPLSGALEDQRTLLQAQVQLALGQFGPASDSLKALAARDADKRAEDFGDTEAQRTSRYARFNLGVALIRGGDAAAGMQVLDELGQASASNEEMRALRDQANVALGFAALQSHQAEKAKGWLERVRLNSQAATKALLGLGWAALELKDTKAALVPWEELTSREPGDAAVLEARLALPFALGQMGETSTALAQYEEALRQYEAESKRLEESITALRGTAWLEDALKLKPGEELGWGTQTPNPPSIAHAAHLDAVFSQHAFQEAFKDQRDLQFMSNNLTEWRDKLDAQLDAIRYRRDVLAPQLADVSARAQRLNQPQAKQRVAKLLEAQNADAARAADTQRRVSEAQERVSRALADVSALRASRLQALQELAVKVLTQQQQRLVGYTTQARFGLAQMYDRALKEKSTQEGSRATSR